MSRSPRLPDVPTDDGEVEVLRATVQRYREKNSQLSQALRNGAREARAALGELTNEKRYLACRTINSILKQWQRALLHNRALQLEARAARLPGADTSAAWTEGTASTAEHRCVGVIQAASTSLELATQDSTLRRLHAMREELSSCKVQLSEAPNRHVTQPDAPIWFMRHARQVTAAKRALEQERASTRSAHRMMAQTDHVFGVLAASRAEINQLVEALAEMAASKKVLEMALKKAKLRGGNLSPGRDVVDQFRDAISTASAQRIAEDQARMTDDKKQAVRLALLQEMTDEMRGDAPEEESFMSHVDVAQLKRDLAEARAAQQSAEQEMWHLGEQLEASLLALERDGIAPPPSVAAQVESNARVAAAESRVVALQGQVMAMQSQVLAMQREKHEAQVGFSELEVVHEATLRENRNYRVASTTKTRTAAKDAAREAAVKLLRAVLVGMSGAVAARSVANWQMNMAKDVMSLEEALSIRDQALAVRDAETARCSTLENELQTEWARRDGLLQAAAQTERLLAEAMLQDRQEASAQMRAHDGYAGKLREVEVELAHAKAKLRQVEGEETMQFQEVKAQLANSTSEVKMSAMKIREMELELRQARAETNEAKLKLARVEVEVEHRGSDVKKLRQVEQELAEMKADAAAQEAAVRLRIMEEELVKSQVDDEARTKESLQQEMQAAMAKHGRVEAELKAEANEAIMQCGEMEAELARAKVTAKLDADRAATEHQRLEVELARARSRGKEAATKHGEMEVELESIRAAAHAAARSAREMETAATMKLQQVEGELAKANAGSTESNKVVSTLRRDLAVAEAELEVLRGAMTKDDQEVKAQAKARADAAAYELKSEQELAKARAEAQATELKSEQELAKVRAEAQATEREISRMKAVVHQEAEDHKEQLLMLRHRLSQLKSQAPRMLHRIFVRLAQSDMAWVLGAMKHEWQATKAAENDHRACNEAALLQEQGEVISTRENIQREYDEAKAMQVILEKRLENISLEHSNSINTKNQVQIKMGMKQLWWAIYGGGTSLQGVWQALWSAWMEDAAQRLKMETIAAQLELTAAKQTAAKAADVAMAKSSALTETLADTDDGIMALALREAQEIDDENAHEISLEDINMEVPPSPNGEALKKFSNKLQKQDLDLSINLSHVLPIVEEAEQQLDRANGDIASAMSESNVSTPRGLTPRGHDDAMSPLTPRAANILSDRLSRAEMKDREVLQVIKETNRWLGTLHFEHDKRRRLVTEKTDSSELDQLLLTSSLSVLHQSHCHIACIISETSTNGAFDPGKLGAIESHRDADNTGKAKSPFRNHVSHRDGSGGSLSPRSPRGSTSKSRAWGKRRNKMAVESVHTENETRATDLIMPVPAGLANPGENTMSDAKRLMAALHTYIQFADVEKPEFRAQPDVASPPRPSSPRSLKWASKRNEHATVRDATAPLQVRPEAELRQKEGMRLAAQQEDTLWSGELVSPRSATTDTNSRARRNMRVIRVLLENVRQQQFRTLTNLVVSWQRKVLRGRLADSQSELEMLKKEVQNLLEDTGRYMEEITTLKTKLANSSQPALDTQREAELRNHASKLRDAVAVLRSELVDMRQEHAGQLKYVRIVFHALKSQLVADIAIADEAVDTERDRAQRLRLEMEEVLSSAQMNQAREKTAEAEVAALEESLTARDTKIKLLEEEVSRARVMVASGALEHMPQGVARSREGVLRAWRIIEWLLDHRVRGTIQSGAGRWLHATRMAATRANVAVSLQTKDDELEQILAVSCAAEERAQQELSSLRKVIADKEAGAGQTPRAERWAKSRREHQSVRGNASAASENSSEVKEEDQSEIARLKRQLAEATLERDGYAARLERALTSPSATPSVTPTASPLTGN